MFDEYSYFDYFYYTGNDIKFLNKARSKFGIIIVYLNNINYIPNEKKIKSYYDERRGNEVTKFKGESNKVLVSYYYYSSKKNMVALNYLEDYSSSISFKQFNRNFEPVQNINLNQLERNIKINRLGLA